MSSEEDEVEDDYEPSRIEEKRTAVEDPALSFIRMIYSDEESLDEEEAYALYQATQLFSSSDEDQEFLTDSDDCGSSEDSDSGEESGEFEYTVVEYVQPSLKKKKSLTEYVAYESESEAEGEYEQGGEGDEPGNSNSESPEDSGLILNAADNTETNSDAEESFSSDKESNWLTYSVFDVDRQLTVGQTHQSATLSSQGSGTPDTLLFSTSSTDKIPNIAPQVLAAISAAAKHMANSRDQNKNASSKYFSYITLRDPFRGGEEVNEEEFLFFEEPEEAEFDSDSASGSTGSDDFDVDEEDEVEDMEDGEEELADIEEENENDSEEVVQVKKTPMSHPSNPNSAKSSSSTAPVPITDNLNRWSRVPIGAFRRSRRPSIPNYHQIHPSTALKTFSDPTAALTLTGPLHNGANGGGEDSFDESNSIAGIPEQRSHSVITWDELDMDIVANHHGNQLGSSPTSSAGTWPIPKRSRSVMPTTNNSEWLNCNWNWEI